MSTTLKLRPRSEFARPLTQLIPMIKSELQQGDNAGHEHYRRAGEMLIEAKDQLSHGRWTAWLTRNFELSNRTASTYMRWARHAQEQIGRGPSDLPRFTSLSEMRGDTERAREKRRAPQEKRFREALRDVFADEFTQSQKARDEEVELHRALAAELIDIGYKALATKLHPDRGGSKAAMTRLNTVREQLKHLAQTRRFV